MTEAIQCEHSDTITDVRPISDVCGPCVEQGDSYPAARYCTVCGYVGCCDYSKNRHMIKHFETIGHAIIRSVDPNEGWMWCYVHEAYVEP